MASKNEAPDYSIAAVSKLTGASCHALRVWERRYGFPVPHRSPSGHRRYDQEQVGAIRAIARRARMGQPIGELIAEYRAGRLHLTEPVVETTEECEASAEPNPHFDREVGVVRLIDCLAEANLSAAERLYIELIVDLSPPEIVSQVIGPAWTEIGERWFQRRAQVFHERVASEFLRRKLDILIDYARRTNVVPRGTFVVGTVQGDRHEGGGLMLSLLLEQAGSRAIYLGVDLPVREYQNSVVRFRPDALALSFVLSRNIKKRFQELSAIDGLPIFVGGRSILNYQGLARRHGLIPLPGPISPAFSQLLVQHQLWSTKHAVSSSPDT